MARLDGKVAVITGGNSGIGLTTAQTYINEGARVVITGRNQERAKQVMKRCKGDRGSIAFVSGDISRRADCDRIVTEAVGILGGLDVVVNSAGVIHHATLEETTDEQWLETMSVLPALRSCVSSCDR